jgi:hypothetical protein
MTAFDIHSLGEGDIRSPHTVEVLPRVVCHATGRNAEGKSVFLSTKDDDHHHHRELVNKSAIATINYSTYRHPVELNADVDIEYAHENEVRTSQLLMHSTDNRTKAKHSPKPPWRTDPPAAWLISLPVAHHQCSASTVWTTPS